MAKKLFISVLCVITITVSGCGNNAASEKAETIASTEANTKSKMETVEDAATEQSSNMIEIVYLAILSGGQTIDDYVNKLNEKNPDFKASVYDDRHYSVMMPDADRRELVEAMKETGIDDNLGKFVTDEKYEGIFTHYEYDKDLENITLYADSSRKKTGFLAASINAGVLSDVYQALNLVPVGKRKYEFKIVDESGNVLYPEP